MCEMNRWVWVPSAGLIVDRLESRKCVNLFDECTCRWRSVEGRLNNAGVGHCGGCQWGGRSSFAHDPCPIRCDLHFARFTAFTTLLHHQTQLVQFGFGFAIFHFDVAAFDANRVQWSRSSLRCGLGRRRRIVRERRVAETDRCWSDGRWTGQTHVAMMAI